MKFKKQNLIIETFEKIKIFLSIKIFDLIKTIMDSLKPFFQEIPHPMRFIFKDFYTKKFH